ncbi:MAG TPA: hypothetical protein VFI83_06935 [Gaiella sp.]|nr:hypothetical protein [Gaiella sp.]
MGASDHLFAWLRSALGHIDPRTDRPQGFVRFGVAAYVALVVALGLIYFAKAVDRLGGEASRNVAAKYDDREFGGGNSLGVDKEALTEARARIPEHAAYRLLVGHDAADLLNYVRYFLMPRRPDPDATWVLCYRCDGAVLGNGIHVVWANDAGITLGRLSG